MNSLPTKDLEQVSKIFYKLIIIYACMAASIYRFIYLPY